MSEAALLLHDGRMAHRRHAPFVHAFGYRLWMVSVDLARLDVAGSWVFRHGFGLLGLRDRDHGPRDGSALLPWVRAQLDAAGLSAYGASVRLMMIPRILGFAFNPIAFYFCRDGEGRLGAVVHQVKNTFGDQHCYLLGVDACLPPTAQVVQSTPKRMHVSPFFDLQGGYRFAFRAPDFTRGGPFDIAIQYGADGHPRLTATMNLATRPATTRALLGMLLSQPLLPFKVVAAIHYQALRLWLRGAKFHSAPTAPVEQVSLESLS